MDPVSQAFIGSGVAQSFAKKPNHNRTAFLCGAVGGLVPDLDVLIRSQNDPLLSIEYHRHFTHSIFFTPIGGFLVAALLWLFFYRKKEQFLTIYLFSSLGYMTHGLLDACTAYGTQLLWPFSDYRATWNTVSIVDPLFTVPLAIFCLFSFKRKDCGIARSGVYLCLVYLLYGFYNQLSARDFITKIAQERGHEIERIFVAPTLANNILWRTVYQSQDKYYIDAVNVAPFKDPVFYPGEKVDVIDKETIFPDLSADSVQRNDIRRFAHFAKDYIYLYPGTKNIIADLRYGTMPNGIYSLWGIVVDDKNPQQHVNFAGMRSLKAVKKDQYSKMIKGEKSED